LSAKCLSKYIEAYKAAYAAYVAAFAAYTAKAKEVNAVYEEAKAAAQKYVATRRSEEASKRAFNFAVKRFEIGMINTYEYTATQSALYNASSSVLSAKYDLIFKLKVLDYYMGNPLKL
jgi:outer membrane protein